MLSHQAATRQTKKSKSSAPIFCDTRIQYLKGVGPHLATVFERRGVYTVGDLLEHFPRAYEDRRVVSSVAELKPQQMVCFKASVLQVKQPSFRARRMYGPRIYELIVGDDTGQVVCKFFRPPYKGYFNQFEPGAEVRVAGKVQLYRGRLELHHPEVQILGPDNNKAVEAEEAEFDGQLVPIYMESPGLKPVKIRRLVDLAFRKVQDVHDVLPTSLRHELQLMPRREALLDVHKPQPQLSKEYLNFTAPSQRRLIFEEFFLMEFYLALKKNNFQRATAPAMSVPTEGALSCAGQLPFELTGAQKKVFSQICQDLQQPHPMHRLVQGDVGSGKTVLAFLSAALVAHNGFQTALMAPTEILAEQHFLNAQKFFQNTSVRVAWLTGKTKVAERRRVCEQLAAGEVQFVVGTHALITDTVQFQNLALVVVDEQHRFGVEQRNSLKKSGHPHFLVMTATPIPRTLAMTAYGDLDVSILDELPPGRRPIVTRKVFDKKKDKVFDFLHDQVQRGRQAYIVYPLIEESEKIDLQNACTEYEKLKKLFPQFNIQLLHGRMSSDEKQHIMNEFRAGRVQVLVSTTVVEVGVDVPNANLMIVAHAERFGLSQLHQLRGRVGRPLKDVQVAPQAYCVLLLGPAVSREAVQRIDVMVQHSDGFKVAEHDLQLRGPGEFFGTKQSGLAEFKLAHLVRDAKVLVQARQAAFDLVRRDPQLERVEHTGLREHYLKQKNNYMA